MALYEWIFLLVVVIIVAWVWRSGVAFGRRADKVSKSLEIGYYCTRCGTPLPRGSKFCSKCGTTQK